MRKVFVGGFTTVAAIIAAWVAFGTGGGGNTGTDCPLPAYPDATCTGIPAGTSLTVVNDDDYVISTDGQVLDGLDVVGCIDVRAVGVTIKNSRAECILTDQSARAQNTANPPLTVQDTEVDCRDHAGVGGVTGIFSRNIKVYRANIHNCENGLEMTGDMLLQDSYIHDLTQCVNTNCTEPDAHTDGIQSQEDDSILIVHNRIYGFGICTAAEHPSGCGTTHVTPPGAVCTPPNDGTCNGTSAVNLGAGFATDPRVVLVQDNLLAGGAFALYCTSHAVSSFIVKDNHFSTVYSSRVGEFGPATECADAETVSGNVYHETGLPVTLD